jgi:hypothetical protein
LYRAGRKLSSAPDFSQTLSIPNWLNTESEGKGINFSAFLQEALKKQTAYRG